MRWSVRATGGKPLVASAKHFACQLTGLPPDGAGSKTTTGAAPLERPP